MRAGYLLHSHDSSTLCDGEPVVALTADPNGADDSGTDR